MAVCAAGLQWSMVMTDNGKIGDVIDIRDTIAKRGAGRRIPMHPDLQRALAALCIAASNRGGPMRANSIVNWKIPLGPPTLRYVGRRMDRRKASPERRLRLK